MGIDTYLRHVEHRITEISGKDHCPGFFNLEGLLTLLSKGYGLGSSLRSRAYRAGLLKQNRLPCPVVSIGNATAGGTGKTPMALYLAGLLRGMGRRPVVLSRGYKGHFRSKAAVVGNGRSVFLDAWTAGDEPHMMASFHHLPVVVGRDRYLAGCLALAELKADLVILDDGFQHLALERDLDLVLLDHDRPLGNHRLLPAGRLREPLNAAGKRAHALILTRCPEPADRDTGFFLDPAGRVAMAMGRTDLPVFKTHHVPFLSKWESNEKKKIPSGLDRVVGRNALLFSGIANNHRFRETVEKLGARVVEHIEFEDHYSYNMRDVQQIHHRMKQTGADLLVTTEKDWVKLDPDIQWAGEVAVIGIHIHLQDPADFERFIRLRLNLF